MDTSAQRLARLAEDIIDVLRELRMTEQAALNDEATLRRLARMFYDHHGPVDRAKFWPVMHAAAHLWRQTTGQDPQTSTDTGADHG